MKENGTAKERKGRRDGWAGRDGEGQEGEGGKKNLPPDGTRAAVIKLTYATVGEAPRSLPPMLHASLWTQVTRQAEENAAGNEGKQEDCRMKCNRSAPEGCSPRRQLCVFTPNLASWPLIGWRGVARPITGDAEV